MKVTVPRQKQKKTKKTKNRQCAKNHQFAFQETGCWVGRGKSIQHCLSDNDDMNKNLGRQVPKVGLVLLWVVISSWNTDTHNTRNCYCVVLPKRDVFGNKVVVGDPGDEVCRAGTVCCGLLHPVRVVPVVHDPHIALTNHSQLFRLCRKYTLHLMLRIKGNKPHMFCSKNFLRWNWDRPCENEKVKKTCNFVQICSILKSRTSQKSFLRYSS